jgi:hypothetical protein
MFGGSPSAFDFLTSAKYGADSVRRPRIPSPKPSGTMETKVQAVAWRLGAAGLFVALRASSSVG